MSSLGQIADLVDRYGDEPFTDSPEAVARPGMRATENPSVAAWTAAADQIFPTYHETPQGAGNHVER